MGESLPEVPAAGVPDDAWLLDVREDDEWAAGHVPGATHVPLGQLGARTAEVPRDQQIYVICRSGIRSARAAQALDGAVAGTERGRRDAGLGGRWPTHDDGFGRHAVRRLTLGRPRSASGRPRSARG